MQSRVIFPRALQYLIAIAEYGSYTRAAEALHVSQPTLSQQIKQLEKVLQSTLLDRSRRSVRLTDAGEVYVRHARSAQRELDAGRRAINDVKNLSRGSLRLGWNPITDYLTCPLLEDFFTNYPGITLKTFEMPQNDIEMSVIEDRIEIGIAFGIPLSMTVSSNEIEMKLLFEEKLCLAVGNTHPYAGKKNKITAQEFGQESLALLNTNFALRNHIDQYCLDNHIQPNIPMESNSLSMIIEMTQAGRHATVLPNSIVQTQCGLYGIELSPELPNKAITLFHRKSGYKSPACEVFIELASDWAGRRLSEIPRRRQRPCPLSKPLYQSENQ